MHHVHVHGRRASAIFDMCSKVSDSDSLSDERLKWNSEKEGTIELSEEGAGDIKGDASALFRPCV